PRHARVGVRPFGHGPRLHCARKRRAALPSRELGLGAGGDCPLVVALSPRDPGAATAHARRVIAKRINTAASHDDGTENPLCSPGRSVWAGVFNSLLPSSSPRSIPRPSLPHALIREIWKLPDGSRLVLTVSLAGARADSTARRLFQLCFG